MRLKTVFSILAICVSFAFTGLSQETYATAKSADNFKTENASGEYVFMLPEDISADDVQLSAEFYTVYFDVSFDDEKNEVQIKLNSLEEKNKIVITRFFISLGLREIMFDEKEYAVHDFYTSYLKGANSEE